MQARIGAILTVIAVLVLVFFWITNNLRIAPAASRPSLPPSSNLGPIVATSLAVSILVGIAFFHYIHYKSTAFAKGILIGAGIAALIEGLCFMAIMR